MSLDALAKLVPPPHHPREANNLALRDQLHAELGIVLPSQLWASSQMYGSGRFANGSLQIYNPMSAHFKSIIDFELDLIRQLPKVTDSLSFDIYPEQPGIFPLARNDNGHALFWFTDGPSDQWPIIAHRREHFFERWDLPLTEFLLKVFSNQIECFIFTNGFEEEDLVFVPEKK